jgi:hypothetical protein
MAGMANLAEGNTIRPSDGASGTVGVHVASANGITTQHRIVHNTLNDLEHAIRIDNGGFNVTIADNRLSSLYGPSGAAVVVAGAGVQLVGNYISWNTSGRRHCGATCQRRGALCAADGDCGTCSNGRHRCEVDPIVLLGSLDGGRASPHPMIASNLFYGQPGVTAIRAANVGGNCIDGSRSLGPCRTAQDCPPPGTCWRPGRIDDVTITDNNFVNDGLMLDLSDLDDGSTTIENLVITGNLHHPSKASGSIVFPPMPAAAANLQVRGNLLSRPSALEGWDWRMGVIGENGPLGPTDDAVTIVSLANRTGAQGQQFATVAIDTAHDASFVYATRASTTAVGVLLDAPADGDPGKIATRGTTTCAVVESAIRPGDGLAPSRTPGRLDVTSDGDRPVVAVALTSKPGGTTGTVRCLVQPTSR